MREHDATCAGLHPFEECERQEFVRWLLGNARVILSVAMPRGPVVISETPLSRLPSGGPLEDAIWILAEPRECTVPVRP
jgi:hypothetical protein